MFFEFFDDDRFFFEKKCKRRLTYQYYYHYYILRTIITILLLLLLLRGVQYCCYYVEGGGSSRRRRRRRRFAATSIFVGEEGVSNEPGRERSEAKEFGHVVATSTTKISWVANTKAFNVIVARVKNKRMATMGYFHNRFKCVPRSS